LYCSPEIGTYAGDVATFPDSKPRLVPERIANRLSRRVGPPGGTEGRANDAAPSRAQTARPDQSAVADADLSRHAGRRDIGRPPVPVVPPAARRQFVVGSATPLAVGDLCGLDAAGVATPRDRRAPSRGVLARVAAGRPRRHAIQSDQHAADHGHARQSADASRPRGVCEDHDGGAAGTGPAQSPGRRDRSQGRIRMGAGAAAAGAAAQAGLGVGRSLVWGDRLCRPSAGGMRSGRQSFLAARLSLGQAGPDQTPQRWQSPRAPRRAHAQQSDPHSRMARGARNSRAGGARWPPVPRVAVVDEPRRPGGGARAGARPGVRASVGPRTVFPRTEAPSPQDGRVAESHGRDGGTRNRGARLGQRPVGDRTRARRAWHRPRAARELWSRPERGARDVAVLRAVRRPRGRSAETPSRAPRIRPHATPPDRQTPLAQLSAQRATDHKTLAAAAADAIG